MDILKQQQHQRQVANWLLVGVGMIIIQVLLGILTLIYSQGKVPILLGVLHQFGAFLLLIFSIEAHYFIKYRAIDNEQLTIKN